jgi:arabinofuranan 3-O-arabinosyltransferase
VSSQQGVRTASLGAGGEAHFAAIRTDRITLRFPTRDPALVRDPSTGEYSTVPVAVSELQIPALTYLLRPVDPASPTGAVCGFGPELRVDGRLVPTAVQGTVGDALSGRPLRLVSCQQGGLTLVAGEHRIQLKDSPSMSAQRVLLSAGAAAQEGSARAERVVRWSAEHRVIRMTAGPATMLVVRENANPGWRATLAGQSLRAVTVDGWAQGWVVPAGRAGDVTLDYAPGRWLRAALLFGALGVLVLFGLALAPDRPGPVAGRARRWSPRVGVVLVVLVGLALGGLLGALVVVLAAAVAGWRQRAAAVVVASGAGIAAIVLALAEWRGWSASGTVPVADVAALVALGAVLGANSVGRVGRQSRPRRLTR